MLLEYDDNIDATRSTELSIVQVLDYPFQAICGVSPFSTHMNLRVLSKAYEAIEPLSFHREIALLRTDRDHEPKLVFTRLFALLPGRGKSHIGFWTFSKNPLHLSWILLGQHCALKFPNTQYTYDLLCLWRLHRRIKRRCLRLWACIFSRQITRYFAGTTCLSWGFLRWLFLNIGHARISLMRFTFLNKASRLPFCFPNSILYQVHPEGFQVCPANPNSSTFHRIVFIGSDFEIHNLGSFSQDSNLSLTTFFSTSRWGCSYNQLVDIGNESHECICFQTCDHDTRDDVDNHTTIFSSCPP